MSATSFYGNGGVSTPAINIINLSGLTGTGATATHDNNSNSATMWHAADANPGTGPATVDDQSLTFSLGGAYNISDMYVWNHNQAGLTARGVNQFDLFVSSDGTNFTQIITDGSLAQAGGGVELAQTINFGSTQLNITHVRLEIDSAHSGSTNDYVGLSEVAFEATAAVPEPTSLTLLSLGGVALIFRRRK
ncbi:discoidin domain-containing protein [Rubritalea tangerina]|uniref:Discoidin domain-containing protein n=1 Tax=Rubritalea tangerina TaxID=430798 RepID=A0ABW4Z938_9BACT